MDQTPARLQINDETLFLPVEVRHSSLFHSHHQSTTSSMQNPQMSLSSKDFDK